jgi:hypothetical protein
VSSRLIKGVGAGAAAGAAGTTALNAVTYLDMVLRGRAASSTPRETVERLTKKVGLEVAGDAETRENRLEALGQLLGLTAGVGTGMALGLAHGVGWRPRPVIGAAVATVAALVAGNGPMTVLGVTDPRSWSRVDWASDVVPHVAYGIAAACVLRARRG